MDDQAGIQVDARGKAVEVFGVFGDNDSVFRDSARENYVVSFAQPATIPRMDRVMQTALVQIAGKRG